MADSIKSGVTVVERRPPVEGSNIATGLGFKHLMYLMEEAVVQHFREHGFGPQMLYERHGLCLEVVDSDARILTGINLDDLVRLEVRPEESPQGLELAFSVRAFVRRGPKDAKALSGRLKALLRLDGGGSGAAPPTELAAHVTGEINRLPSLQRTVEELKTAGDAEDPAVLLRRAATGGSNAFVWERRIPYFYCHYGERIQHSGYLRLMEEAVELFLAGGGISIRSMLERRRWVPIVTNAGVKVLREARMEEDIYTVFVVENIYKKFTYTSRLDWYVSREGRLVHTATGTITHGYLELRSRDDWSLVSFDEELIVALRGEGGER